MNIDTTRRALLKAAPLGALAVAVPAAASMETFATSSEWTNALAVYREAERKLDALWDKSQQSDAAYEASVPPRVNRYFDDYGLGIGMKRRTVEFKLELYAARTGDQIDVIETANEFDAYQTACLEAQKRCRVWETYAEFREFQPTFDAARDALMRVSAPSAAALLTKIEIAGTSLSEEHANAVLADARRLLGGVA